MPTAANYTDVLQRFYLAYFGRPADPGGLIFNANQLLAAGAPTTIAGLLTSTNPTVLALINGFSSSAESTQLLSGSTTTVSVSQLYQNLLGRAGDAAGVTYWQTEIDSGRLSLARAALAIADAGAAAAVDSATIAAKVAVATNYTTSIDTEPERLAYSGTAAAASARALLSSVTAANAGTTALLATFQTSIDNNLVTLVTGRGGAATGTTFPLTTGIDSLVGTANNDTFSATLALTVTGVDNTTTKTTTITGTVATGSSTFNATDTINGAGGSGDILNLTIDTPAGLPTVPSGNLASVFPVNIPSANVSNVELINVRYVPSDRISPSAVVNAANFVGATVFTSDRSTGAVSFDGLASGQSAGVNGDGLTNNGFTSVSYGSAVTSATLNISGGTTGFASVALLGPGLTSATINSTGAANTVGISIPGALTPALTALTINATSDLTIGNFQVLGSSASFTVTVAGAAASVNLGTLVANVKSLAASGLTAGGVTTTLSGDATFNFTGGGGNDLVTTGAVLTAGASVDGGAGTGDRLTIANSTHLTSTTAQFYKNFEVLALNSGVTADVSLLAANNTITSERINGGAIDITLNGLNATQAGAITIVGSQTGSNGPTFGVTGATAVGQLDTLGITFSDGSSAVNNIQVANINAAGVETVNLTATDNITATRLTGLTALTNLNVTGGGNVSLTTGSLFFNPNTVINASTLTGTFAFIAFSAVSVVGASPSVSITGSASNTNTLAGNAGSSVLVGGARADTLTGFSGNDRFTGGLGGDTINAGSGNDTFIYTAAGETFVGTVTSGATVLTGVDVISGGLATGDVIQLYSGAGISSATTVGTSLLTAAGINNAVAIVRGNFANGIFTTNAAGADSLVQFDDNGTAAGGGIDSIVLVGFAGNLTAGSNTLSLA